jgi:hypothetical protein
MMQKGIVTKVENPTSGTLRAVFENGETKSLPPNSCFRDPGGIHLTNLDEIRKQGAKITFDLTEVL